VSIKLRDFYELGEQINTDPMVCVFEKFLSDLEIEQLLAASETKLQRAQVSAEEAGVTSEGRTGSNCWIPHRYNGVIEVLSERIAEVVGVPLENAESLQVVHYQQGQEYAPHYDAWDADTERGRRCMARGGQRLVTCLMYLNDVKEGGGTCFPNLDLEVRARRGRMVIFHNCHRGNSIRHKDSLHGGMPVLSGEKWACNFWFREGLYQTASASTGKKEIAAKRSFKRVI